MIWIKIALIAVSSFMGWLHAAMQYKWKDERTRKHKRLRKLVFPALWIMLALSMLVVWTDDKAASRREMNAHSEREEIKKQHDELVHQQKQERSKVLRAIATKVGHLIRFREEQFSVMAISAGHLELNSIADPSEDQIRKVFSKLQPTGKSMMCILPEKRMLNWLEFMDIYNRDTIKIIDDIYLFMPFLDSELAALLENLKGCNHFKYIALYANGSVPGNRDLGFAAGLFTEYQNKIKPVQEYYIETLRAHDNRTPARAVIPMPMAVKQESN